MYPPPLRTPARLRKIRKARYWIVLFMIGMVLSGLTAFPLESELQLMTRVCNHFEFVPEGVSTWVQTVYDGLSDTNEKFPFLAYGTDWLGFAHLIIAMAFVGPLVDPMRNKWVITFGLISCACVIPFALLAGQMRDIPIYWRLVDCCFGIGGAAVLWPAYKIATDLERLPKPLPPAKPVVQRPPVA